MIINIIRDTSFYEALMYNNQKIKDFAPRFSYNEHGQNYNFAAGRVSRWFDPENVRDLGLSRTYPHMCSVQYRPEYCLIMHCSNYLPLFLMRKLYFERKGVLFEDIGAGLGWLQLYLQALGFTNFHNIDNYSQVSKPACELFSQVYNLNVKFNEKGLIPIISNNVAAPPYPYRDISKEIFNMEFENTQKFDRVHPELELIINATNPIMVKAMKEQADKIGFKHLCTDSDDLSFAYCRVDKHEEFSQKLVKYGH